MPHLLEGYGQFVFSDKFNQDPLEQHFGCQKMKLDCNENPIYNELKLEVATATMVKIMKGNTRERNDSKTLIDITDTIPLPKKKISE